MGCQITMVQIVTSALLDDQNKNTLIPTMMFLDDLKTSTDNNKANLYNMNFHSVHTRVIITLLLHQFVRTNKKTHMDQRQYQVSMAGHCLTVQQKLSLLQRNFSTLTSYHNSAFGSLDSCRPYCNIGSE